MVGHGRPGRAPGCGHLRAQPASAAGRGGAAARDRRQQADRPPAGPWPEADVDRSAHRCRAAGHLARADGDAGIDPVARRHIVGRTRLPRDRPAARHGRPAADAGAEGAGGRRRGRHHAAGNRGHGCPQGAADVREDVDRGAGRGGEHEHASVQQLRPRRCDFRRWWWCAAGRGMRRGAAGASCRSTPACAPNPTAAGRRWSPRRIHRAARPISSSHAELPRN